MTYSHVIVASGINAHAFVFKKINIMLYKVLHIDTELLYNDSILTTTTRGVYEWTNSGAAH